MANKNYRYKSPSPDLPASPCLSPLRSSSIIPPSRPYSTSLASQSFTVFPKLPIELQAQIWHHALPGPRAVQVRRRWRTVVDGVAPIEYSDILADPIIILHVCRHSRDIARKRYELRFTSHFFHSAHFDRTQDVILMEDNLTLGHVMRTHDVSQYLEVMRFMGIDPTYPLNTCTGISASQGNRRIHDITNDGVRYLAQAIRKYNCLQELFVLYPIVDDDKVPQWFETSVIDLLEEAVQRLGLDPRDMPHITCLPYRAGSCHGQKIAIEEWMTIGGY